MRNKFDSGGAQDFRGRFASARMVSGSYTFLTEGNELILAFKVITEDCVSFVRRLALDQLR